MRYLPLLLLLTSCQTWGWSDTADALMPDEFTMGRGSSTMDTHTTGGYIGHQTHYEYDGEGEGESTYASLTWHLPSIKSDNGMSRETQRNLSLALDRLVGEDVEDKEKAGAVPAGVGLNLREGVELPPAWVGFAVLAAIAALIGTIVAKNRRRSRWR
jgi:hypothetical protein